VITTSVSPSTTAHHGLAAHEVVLLLGADPHRGLSSEDAIDRLARFGPNTLPAAKGAGLPMRILRQFHHPLVNVLLAAGVITAGLGEYVDSP
jgi:cation-transporting ATPase F